MISPIAVLEVRTFQLSIFQEDAGTRRCDFLIPLRLSIEVSSKSWVGILRYPLVNVYITMENHYAINRKTHYLYVHFQYLNVIHLTRGSNDERL